jgi:hypothetical protein
MAHKFVLVRAHLQDILLLFMFIITEDPVKKNGARFTEEGKPTTPRRENRNSTRNRNFKSKRTRSLCVGTSDPWNDTKKHTTKSRETIPLKHIRFKFTLSPNCDFDFFIRPFEQWCGAGAARSRRSHVVLW